MDGRLEGARAVITGGGRGIGKAIALAFAREGARVAVCSRGAAALEGVAAEVREAGGDCIPVVADVTSDDDVIALERDARKALGGPATVLVNNAGLYIPSPFADYTMSDWQQILEVNVLGTVRVTRTFLPSMRSARAGRIINVASTAGKWGTANQSAYNASKHAVLGLTRSLALEVAREGVRVNAICPGWVDTELIDDSAHAQGALLDIPAADVRAALAERTPIGRMATPDEVAHLAVYLASSESDAMTGVGLTLAGGLILI